MTTQARLEAEWDRQDRRARPWALALQAVLTLVFAFVAYSALVVDYRLTVLAAGGGRDGVVTIDHKGDRMRGSPGSYGTFREPDGTVTSVSFQGLPTELGDEVDAVRLGNEAWPRGTGPGVFEAVVTQAFIGLTAVCASHVVWLWGRIRTRRRTRP